MKRTIATLAALALAAGSAVASGDVDAAAYPCTGRAGTRYYSVTCQGTGTFRAQARCVDGDGQHPYYDYANWATAPNGVSDDYCKFGYHVTAVYRD
jgi:hypothetical protein